jgi:hypothetical protein
MAFVFVPPLSSLAQQCSTLSAMLRYSSEFLWTVKTPHWTFG